MGCGGSTQQAEPPMKPETPVQKKPKENNGEPAPAPKPSSDNSSSAAPPPQTDSRKSSVETVGTTSAPSKERSPVLCHRILVAKEGQLEKCVDFMNNAAASHPGACCIQESDKNRFHVVEHFLNPSTLVAHAKSTESQRSSLKDLFEVEYSAILNASVANCPILEQLGGVDTALVAGFMSKPSVEPSESPVLGHGVLIGKPGQEAAVISALEDVAANAQADTNVFICAAVQETANPATFHLWEGFSGPGGLNGHMASAKVQASLGTLMKVADFKKYYTLNTKVEAHSGPGAPDPDLFDSSVIAGAITAP